jgi:hypothetical protein
VYSSQVLHWRSRAIGFCSALVCAVAACHEPSSGAQPSSVAPARSTNETYAPAQARASAPAEHASASADAGSESAAAAKPVSSAIALDAGTAGAPSTPTVVSVGALLDADGKPLPQTDERPSLSSPAFQQRVAAVARAIITGDAEPATAAFFPLVAYQQVKDIAKPERDYRFRLLANFKRDVLEYHHALGAAAAEAKFAGITVSERDAKWMAPGSEGNKLGYFRVLRSHLHFTLPAGRSRDFELTSLISWRGEWYVVHLHGFK